MIKRVLVTGCGGMLGCSIYAHLISKNYTIKATDIDVNEKWISYLDVRDYKDALNQCRKFKPDIILHLAALTSLEYCENNPDEGFKTNFVGTRNMAQIAKLLKIPLVYISTAGVFDGKKRRYSEDDNPNPINVYGKTKLYGEIAVENSLEKYFIVRAGWMVGGGRKDKKFISLMLKQIISGKRDLKVVDDKYGTITYTKDFANNLEKLFNTRLYGKYHMVCNGETSRYEIIKHVLKRINIKNIKLNKVHSNYFAKDFPVERSSSERLINQKLKKINLDFMGKWKDSIDNYLKSEWSSQLPLR